MVAQQVDRAFDGNLHNPLLLVDPFVAAKCFVFVVTKLYQIGTGLGLKSAARMVSDCRPPGSQ